jgi:hypothetical protein
MLTRRSKHDAGGRSLQAMNPRLRLTLLAALCGLVTLPAPARAQLPPDVARIHSAVTELAKAKQRSKARAGARDGAAERAMNACRTSGPGWRRIRSVGDRSQRDAYARGARILWRDLSEVAARSGSAEVLSPLFERFLRRLSPPPADPVLAAGVEALRGRFRFVAAAYSFGSCATFEKQLRQVREFRIGGRHGVAGDYRAGRMHNRLIGYVAARQRRADARNGGSSFKLRLDAARNQIVALGGDYGYASYFTAAYSLNN